MAKKKQQPELTNERIIHVKAISEIYSVNQLVPERKVEKVLTEIRDNFVDLKSKKYSGFEYRLVVKTCIHNPTLF